MAIREVPADDDGTAPSALAPIGYLDVGIYPGIPERLYHQDPAIRVSASASVLRTLYDQSPEHAWTQHPRLNPAWKQRGDTDATIAGSILHWLMLGQGSAPHRVLNFDDYRTDRARKARDDAVADGLKPILPGKFEPLQPVAARLRQRLAEEFPRLWAAMTAATTLHEVTMIWLEGQTICRCRFDVLPEPVHPFTIDLKFTGLTAEPDQWSRTLRDDYLIQSALYPRAVQALRGDQPAFMFVVCETTPPYGTTVHSAGPEICGVGERRLNIALSRWRECLDANKWPGYRNAIHWTTAPNWWLAQDEERAVLDQIAMRLDKPAYDPFSLAEEKNPFI